MKQNTKYLLIVAAAIIVLGGALTTLLLIEKGAKKITGSASSAVNPIPVLEKTSADVVSMQVTNQYGTYTILPLLPSQQAVPSKMQNESSPSSTSIEEPKIIYTVQELSGLPMDTTVIGQTAENGYKLTATQKIGKVEKLSDFGLEKPEARVKIDYQDGSTFQYDVGGAFPSNSSSNYLYANGIVYAVDINRNLFLDKQEFISTKVLDFSDTDSSTLEFSGFTMGGSALSIPITFDKTDDGYAITSPASAPVDVDKALSLTDMLTMLNAEYVTSVHPNAADLKSYGLDAPAHTLQFKQGEKSYVLLSGVKEDENFYVMLKGVDVVYKVAESSLSAWLDVKNAFDLRSKYILDQDIETIKSLRLTVGDDEQFYEISRKNDEKKSTEDKTVYNYTVKKNLIQPVDYETTCKTILQNLNGITLLEDAQNKPTGVATYRMEYTYFDSDKKNTIEFYMAGNRRYTAVLNGMVCGNVTENDVKILQCKS